MTMRQKKRLKKRGKELKNTKVQCGGTRYTTDIKKCSGWQYCDKEWSQRRTK